MLAAHSIYTNYSLKVLQESLLYLRLGSSVQMAKTAKISAHGNRIPEQWKNHSSVGREAMS